MNAPVVLADASGLVETVRRAMALLDEGDLVAARELAGRAYDEAKAGVALGRKFKASKALIDKARQLQGDALFIEAQANLEVASWWQTCRKNGLVKNGRPRKSGCTVHAVEYGFTRKDVHEAERLKRATHGDLAVIRAAIDERIERGLEPTRAAVRRAVGLRSAGNAEAALFRRALKIEFDAALTTWNQLGQMRERAARMARFLDAVRGHGVPANPDAPVADMLDATELNRMWEAAR